MSADDSSLIVPSEALRGLLTEAGEEKLDSVGHVSALAQPVLDTSDVHAQLDFAAARDRVEQADALEAGAALTLTAVGYHDMIKGRLLAAAPSQTDRHHNSPSGCQAANCNDNQGLRATNP